MYTANFKADSIFTFPSDKNYNKLKQYHAGRYLAALRYTMHRVRYAWTPSHQLTVRLYTMTCTVYSPTGNKLYWLQICSNGIDKRANQADKLGKCVDDNIRVPTKYFTFFLPPSSKEVLVVALPHYA